MTYAIRTCAHYGKGSHGSLLHFQDSSPSFSVLLPLCADQKETKQERRVSDCAILESVQHPNSTSRLYVWKITLFVTSF